MLKDSMVQHVTRVVTAVVLMAGVIRWVATVCQNVGLDCLGHTATRHVVIVKMDNVKDFQENAWSDVSVESWANTVCKVLLFFFICF